MLSSLHNLNNTLKSVNCHLLNKSTKFNQTLGILEAKNNQSRIGRIFCRDARLIAICWVESQITELRMIREKELFWDKKGCYIIEDEKKFVILSKNEEFLLQIRKQKGKLRNSVQADQVSRMVYKYALPMLANLDDELAAWNEIINKINQFD